MLRWVCGRQLLTAREKCVDRIGGFGAAIFGLLVDYRLSALLLMQCGMRFRDVVGGSRCTRYGSTSVPSLKI